MTRRSHELSAPQDLAVAGHTAATPSAPRGTWLLLIVLTLLQALPFAFGVVDLDVARDLQAAWGIATGRHYPLAGPVINASVHLGPLWFYLLAVPLGLSGSIAVTLVCVGLVSALKYALAFAVGRGALDARYGLLFALALALPGWSLVAQLSVTHTSVIEAASLAVAYVLLRLAQGASPLAWLACGLLQGLALHAHPATVVLALLVPIVLYYRRATLLRDAGWMLLGLGLLALPFLPAIVAEAQQDWSGFSRLRDYGQGHDVLLALRETPALLRGILVAGPQFLSEDLAARTLAPWLRALFAAVALAAVVGWSLALLRADARRRLLTCAGLVASALLLLSALRTETPYYMALVWLPWWSALLALGWWQLDRRAKAVLPIGVAVMLLTTTGSVLLVRRGEQGLLRVPAAALNDVRSPRVTVEASYVPAWRLDSLGRELCALPGPVVLHGGLALAYDSALGLSGRIACGDAHDVGIGGGAALLETDHRLGLVPRQLRRLGVAGATWAQAFALRPKAVIAAEASPPLARGEDYPFRERQRGTIQTRRYRFRTDAHDVVIVHRLFFAYDDARVTQISANGRPQQAIEDGFVSAFYRCADCATGAVDWDLTIASAMPEWTDIVVFDPAAVGD